MEKVEEYEIKADNLIIPVAILGGKGTTKRYHVYLPAVAPGTKALMDYVKHGLITEVAISTQEILDPKAIHILKEKFTKRAKLLIQDKLPNISEDTAILLINILMQEMLGLGEIEYLLADENLEEIVITSSKEPVRIYHKRHGWLETNLAIENEDKILNYANIIGRRVGRQITTLNPLLDAHLVTGDRANAVLFPICTKGHTVTIRRFARDPWTLTDFIKNKTVNSKVLALIWLATQYEMNVLISGGTASGKTSFLNVCMPFIPCNHRIVSIEDSVHGSSNILYKEKGVFKQSTIGKLIDTKLKTTKQILSDGTEVSPGKNIQIFTITKEGKTQLTAPSSLIRHKISKPLYEITLASGKRIQITGDHSLFSLTKNDIAPIKCSDLDEGDFIATPRRIAYQAPELTFDLTEHLEHFTNCQFEGKKLQKLLVANKDQLLKYKSKAQVQNYFKQNRLPVSLFLQLNLSINEKVKKHLKLIPLRSTRYGRIGMPLLVPINNDLACLIGLWLADGSYDKNSIIYSVVDEECNAVVKRIAHSLNTTPKLHSDAFSLMIHSTIFKRFFKQVLQLDGTSYTKKVPPWIYNLPNEKIAQLLCGYMSGDGWARENDIAIGSCSSELLKNVQTLFLRLGIHLRFSRHQNKDKTYHGTISSSKQLQRYIKKVGFLQQHKTKKLSLAIKEKTKDVADIIPLDYESYLPLKHSLGEQFKKSISYKTWKSWQQRYKKSNIGRSFLQKLLTSFLSTSIYLTTNTRPFEKIAPLAFNDIFWDKILNIKKKAYSGYVYDISVPETENFVCENIMCHNTRELQLPKYLYWCPLTIRQPNPEGKGEVTMLDLLVNSLRMRPDRIVLGEMRRKDQAAVLFEAMHTGHSVYATVHADSVLETIERLINPPIEVPKNLLLGVNLNVVMFRDRRRSLRRVFQIGEFLPTAEEGVPTIKPHIMYRWKPVTDEIVEHSSSVRLYEELSRHTGMTLSQIEKDLMKKKAILDWMVKNNIRHVDQVGELIQNYYLDPNTILEKVGGV